MIYRTKSYNEDMNILALLYKKYAQRIISGDKTIESRFGKRRPLAWKCKAGDVLYIKETGGDIVAKATVAKVERYALDNPEQLLELEGLYWEEVHGASHRETAYWQSAAQRGVKYAVFVYLDNVEQIAISKSLLPKNLAYASAWIRNFKPPIDEQLRLA